MRVEARYKGKDVYYMGTVQDLNIRDDVILSYQILYDDGEMEKAVKRSLIRVDPHEAMQINQHIERLSQQQEERRVWRKNRNAQILKKKSKWDSKQRALIDGFGEIMQGELDGGDQPLQEVLRLVSLSNELFHLRRRRVGVRVQLEYTRMPLPFGWVKRIDEGTETAYFELIATGQRRKMAPAYTYKDDVAVRRIQAAWRGFMGKKDFQKRLVDENPLTLTRTAIREGAKKAWVGFGEEGMTIEMWLGRLGLSYLVQPRAGGKDKLMALTLDRLHRMNDQDLQTLGVTEERARRVMLQLLAKEPQAIEEFQFTNYYTGPSDARTLQECIAQSKDRLIDLLLKQFPGNNKRVEKMAEAITKSAFPITNAQLKWFTAKYSGKASAAQDNINELVNVRTTSGFHDEWACFEVYKKTAKCLCTVLANLSIISLRDAIQEALTKVEETLVLNVFGATKPLASMNASTTLSRPNTSGSTGSNKRPDQTSISRGTILQSTLNATKMSGPGGKAAFFLRVHCFEKVLKYHASSLIIQSHYRGYQARKLYQLTVALREVSDIFSLIWCYHVLKWTCCSMLYLPALRHSAASNVEEIQGSMSAGLHVGATTITLGAAVEQG